MYNNHVFNRRVKAATLFQDNIFADAERYDDWVERDISDSAQENADAYNLIFSNNITELSDFDFIKLLREMSYKDIKQENIHKIMLPAERYSNKDIITDPTVVYVLRSLQTNTPLLVAKTICQVLQDVQEMDIVRLDAREFKANIAHESYIVVAINRVLPQLANFTRCVALRDAGPVFCSTTNNKELAIFSNEQPYHSMLSNSFIYYEHIPAKPLAYYLEKDLLTLDMFLEIFSQIMYALQMLQDTVKFTHYNLNLDNIMIREFAQEQLFNYGDRQVVSKYLPIFISPSYSYMYKREHRRRRCAHYLKYGRADKFHPLQDIYLTLMLITQHCISDAYRASKNSQDILTYCRQFIRFFNVDNSVEEIVQTQMHNYYAFFLPNSYGLTGEKELTLTMTDFISYTQKHYSIIDKTKSNNVFIYPSQIKTLLDLFSDASLDYQQYLMSWLIKQLKEAMYINTLTFSETDPLILKVCNLYYQYKSSKVIDMPELVDFVKQVVNTWYEMDKSGAHSDIIFDKIREIFSYTQVDLLLY